LCRDSRAAVQNDIVESPSAGWQIALMPLIEAGDNSRSQHCNPRPSEDPSGAAWGRQGFAPRTEKQYAQQPIAEDVSGFAQERVIWLKARIINAENEVQERIQEPARILR